MAFWTAVSRQPFESLLVWWHECTPILSTGTCPKVRGHPVRSNPHSNLSIEGDSGNQMCDGGPRCLPNTLTNHFLIEFQLTCKNLVQFCHLIFLTDVSVIPVKWSAIVTSSVQKHKWPPLEWQLFYLKNTLDDGMKVWNIKSWKSS